METELIFRFEGKDTVLDVLEHGGLLVDFLGKPNNQLCPLVGTEIQKIIVLGAGKYGQAFLVKSKTDGERIFVMKTVKLKVSKNLSPRDYSMNDIIKIIRYNSKINPEIIKWVNNYKTEFKKDDVVVVPTYAIQCRTTEPIIVPRFNLKGKSVFPIGSYLCTDEGFSEFAIASMCGRLYSMGVSVNFIEMYNFAVCDEEAPKSYTFMEQTDGDIRLDINRIFNPIYSKYNIEYVEKCFVIQVLHAIAVYQTVYGISHNDLHPGNIFFNLVDEKTMFNGQTLYDADYFHYSISRVEREPVNLYIPAIPYIAKIADFGKAFKWYPPKIGQMELIQTGFTGGDTPWMPNWFIPQYDTSFFLISIMAEGPSSFASQIFDKLKIPRELFRPENRPIFAPVDTNSKYYKSMPYRFNPSEPLSKFTRLQAKKILTNKALIGEFTTKPEKGKKIVTLGEI